MIERYLQSSEMYIEVGQSLGLGVGFWDVWRTLWGFRDVFTGKPWL